MNSLQQTPTKKDKLFDLLSGLKGQLLSLLIGVVLYLGYLLICISRQTTNFILQYLTTPYKRMMGALCDLIPFSVMEIVVLLTVLVIIAVIIRCVVLAIRKENRMTVILRTIAGLAAAGILIWDGYCWLWGLNYYGYLEGARKN